MVSSIFFKLLLEKNSIQLRLRQFLFDINRINNHGEILKKQCSSHHASEAASTHIFEKSCFRLRQKKLDTRKLASVSSFSAVYRVSIPGGFPHRSIPLFQAS